MGRIPTFFSCSSWHHDTSQDHTVSHTFLAETTRWILPNLVGWNPMNSNVAWSSWGTLQLQSNAWLKSARFILFSNLTLNRTLCLRFYIPTDRKPTCDLHLTRFIYLGRISSISKLQLRSEFFSKAMQKLFYMTCLQDECYDLGHLQRVKLLSSENRIQCWFALNPVS